MYPQSIIRAAQDRLDRVFGALFAGAPSRQLAMPGGLVPDIAEGGDAVFNSGGPSSRTRKERIKSSALRRVQQARGESLGALKVGGAWRMFGNCGRRRELANELLADYGFAVPEEAFLSLGGIPQIRLHVAVAKGRYPERNMPQTPEERLEVLRVALVLGKCSNGLYDPERPTVWTEARLGQWLNLYEIRESFYGD